MAQIEPMNNVAITGNQQHGFKKGRGTATASLLFWMNITWQNTDLV